MHKSLTFVILDSQFLFDCAYQSLDFFFFLNLMYKNKWILAQQDNNISFNFLLRQGLLIGQDRWCRGKALVHVYTLIVTHKS